jgi:hypothetical protein
LPAKRTAARHRPIASKLAPAPPVGGPPPARCGRLRGAGIRGEGAAPTTSFSCGLPTVSRCTPRTRTPRRSGLARETHRRTPPSHRQQAGSTTPLWEGRPRPECVGLRGAGIRGEGAPPTTSFPCGLSTVSRCNPRIRNPPVGAGLSAKNSGKRAIVGKVLPIYGQLCVMIGARKRYEDIF